MLKHLHIHRFIIVFIVSLCNLSFSNAQSDGDKIILGNYLEKFSNPNKNSITWDKIWFSETDVKGIDTSFYIREKRRSYICSMTMKDFYECFKLSVEEGSNFNSKKAVLLTDSDIILFDYIMEFKDGKMYSTPNTDQSEYLEHVRKSYVSWIESVLTQGYSKTRQAGLAPLPKGYRWR